MMSPIVNAGVGATGEFGPNFEQQPLAIARVGESAIDPKRPIESINGHALVDPQNKQQPPSTESVVNPSLDQKNELIQNPVEVPTRTVEEIKKENEALREQLSKFSGATNLQELKEQMRKSFEDEGLSPEEIEIKMAGFDGTMTRTIDAATSTIDQDKNLSTEEKEDKKSKLRKFVEASVVGLADWEKDAAKHTDFSTILDLLLTSGDKWVGSTPADIKGGLESDSLAMYLVQILEKGDKKVIAQFFRDTLNDADITESDVDDGDGSKNILILVTRFNTRVDLAGVDEISSRLKKFLEGQGNFKSGDFTQFIEMFKSLGRMNSDKLKIFFGLDKKDTSVSATAKEQVSSAQSTTPENVIPLVQPTTPDNSQSTVTTKAA